MQREKKKVKRFSKFMNNKMDYILFITVLILLSLGVVMVLSASAPSALSSTGKSYTYFLKQFEFALAGIGLMLFFSKSDYRFLKKYYKVIYVISVAILLLVLVPKLGKSVNGAKRWIDLGIITFQPSEIVKILMIIFYAGILVKDREELGSFWKGIVKHLLYLVPIAALLVIEPHVSTTMVISIVVCIMMIMAGCKFWQFILSGLIALSAAGGIATVLYYASSWFQKKFQYIVTRFITFTDPWQDATGKGWQIIQSLYAIGSGGLFGVGLGESKQKYLYLSEPYNDFIFSVLAEELGFVGCLLVFVLFAFFIWRGVLIAMRAPDMFGSLVAIGITALVGVQVIINVAVVTSSMPVTGMQLPFFSYGGTALALLLCEVGILLSISRAGNKNN